MSITIDNDCLVPCGGGAGPPGPPGPPGAQGPPGEIPCAKEICLDFDEFSQGETNIIVKGVTFSLNKDVKVTPLMIIDTTNDGNAQKQLLTPNETFAGPGVGAGGESGQPGANGIARGNGLIVSADGNSRVVTAYSGNDAVIDIVFECTVNFQSIDFINVAQGGGYIRFYDSKDNLITEQIVLALGLNSYSQTDMLVNVVKRISIELKNDIVITQLCYIACCIPDPPAGGLCLEKVCENFDEYDTGTKNPVFGDYTVTNNAGGIHPMMIFDSDNPTAGQENIGAPNMDFAGPGVGIGGESGQPGENAFIQNKTLIVSASNDSMNPDAYNSPVIITFTFTNKVNVDSLSILDVDTTGNCLNVYDENDVLISTRNILNLGTNSFQTVIVGAKVAKRMDIILTGSAAITELCYTRCRQEIPPEALQTSIEFSQAGIVFAASVGLNVWIDFFQYRFPGSASLSIISSLCVSDPFLGQGGGGNQLKSYEIRILDVTNSGIMDVVIAGPVIVNNANLLTYPFVHSLIPINFANISPGPAVWALQARRTSGGGVLRFTYWEIKANNV